MDNDKEAKPLPVDDPIMTPERLARRQERNAREIEAAEARRVDVQAEARKQAREFKMAARAAEREGKK